MIIDSGYYIWAIGGHPVYLNEIIATSWIGCKLQGRKSRYRTYNATPLVK